MFGEAGTCIVHQAPAFGEETISFLKLLFVSSHADVAFSKNRTWPFVKKLASLRTIIEFVSQRGSSRRQEKITPA